MWQDHWGAIQLPDTCFVSCDANSEAVTLFWQSGRRRRSSTTTRFRTRVGIWDCKRPICDDFYFLTKFRPKFPVYVILLREKVKKSIVDYAEVFFAHAFYSALRRWGDDRLTRNDHNNIWPPVQSVRVAFKGPCLAMLPQVIWLLADDTSDHGEFLSSIMILRTVWESLNFTELAHEHGYPRD